MGQLVFMGWVISQANEWEDYSNYFGDGAEISRNWATVHFLISDGQPRNCHGSGGCATQLTLMHYNERIRRLKVHWKPNLLPSWTQFHSRFYLTFADFDTRLCPGFPGGAVVGSLPASAGDTGSSPGLGGSHMPRSNKACEPQLLSLHVWSLCSATREAAIVRGPRTAMKSGPTRRNWRKPSHRNEDPTQPKINKIK